jgi:putative ABC transport system substrate-binding protein
MNLSLHLAQELRAATGVEYRFLSVSGADDFEKVFQDARRWGAGAVLIGPTGDNYVYRSRIASLALQMGLATMTFVAIVEDGGLMSYGPDEAEFARIIAKHIDRILRGARPGELPVEQPSTFQLVVNLKTAKALGVKFPPSVLLRADRVIE